MAAARDLAHILNEIGNGLAMRQTAMAAVQRLVGGNLVGLNEVAVPVDPRDARSVAIHFPTEPSIQDLHIRVSATLHRHPLAMHYFSSMDRAPGRISDHEWGLTWRSNPVYSEVFVPIEAAHQLVIPLFSANLPTRVDAYAINREKGRDFSDEDVAMAAALQLVLIGQHQRLPEYTDLQLTERQRQVLARVLEEKTEAVIARELGVSVSRVKKCLLVCRLKLGNKRTAAGAAQAAARLGLINGRE